MKRRIIAFAPIKLNNERLPNKNIKYLGEKRLLEYSISVLLDSGCFDDVYVYCSQDSIIDLLPSGCKFLKRSESLDLPSTRGAEIYSEFARQVESDFLFLFHVTSPYITVDSIKNSIASLDNNFDSAFAVRRVQTFCWNSELTEINFNRLNPLPTQTINPVFIETSSFYLAPAIRFLVGQRYGINPHLVEVSRKESIDIDTIEDWLEAELYL